MEHEALWRWRCGEVKVEQMVILEVTDGCRSDVQWRECLTSSVSVMWVEDHWLQKVEESGTRRYWHSTVDGVRQEFVLISECSCPPKSGLLLPSDGVKDGGLV